MLRILRQVSALLIIFSISHGLHADNDNYNRISFDIAAEEEIANDLLVATLSARQSGEDLRTLADQVNKTMNWALKESRRVNSVKTQTLNYSTSPRYEKNRQTGWTVSQSLKLSSTHSDDLTSLMGKLQERLQLNSVTYEVTREKREALQEKLTSDVLKKLQNKAARIVTDMQRSGYRIVSINIRHQHALPPRPMMTMARGLSMADSVSAPGLKAGTQVIQVSASATIELQ